MLSNILPDKYSEVTGADLRRLSMTDILCILKLPVKKLLVPISVFNSLKNVHFFKCKSFKTIKTN